MIFEALSERYGWTPDQIRSMRYDDVLAYIDIISMKNRISKANHGRA